MSCFLARSAGGALTSRIYPGGFSGCRNKFGYITYPGGDAGKLTSTTQVFKNREIWGVEASLLRRREGYNFDFVPTGAFEKGMIKSLYTYLRIAYECLNYTDQINVEAGMVNVAGYKLAMPNNYFDQFWGPIFGDITVKTTVHMNDPESINTALLKIFEDVFDSAGTERPKNLEGFPTSS